MTDEIAEATQRARALGLEGRFDEAHQILDALPADHANVAIERGRLLRTAGDPSAAKPYFDHAAESADDPDLRADALHMLALIAPPEEQSSAHHRALEFARESSPKWVPSILNNRGMFFADHGDWDAALEAFQEALRERELRADAEATRIAKWMVAWAMRHLFMFESARAIQLALKAELDALGESDEFVDQELELLA